MQSDATTLPDYIQQWLGEEAGPTMADSSTEGVVVQRETKHNGNGQHDPVQTRSTPEQVWRPMTLAEFRARPQVVGRSWLVDALLPHDGVSLLVGSPKAGKSTLVRCLAATVVGEYPHWLDRAVKAGLVLHLSLEERTETVVEHYLALDAPGERIVLIEDPWPKPKNPAAKLEALIADYRPALVIIDPLIRCVSIRNTNDYAEASEALDPYISLARRYKAHILFVHHANKRGGEQGNEVMGSQAIAGSMDTILSLKNNGGQRTIQAWGRDGVEMPATQLALEEGGWMVVTGTTQAIRAKTLQENAVEVLRESPAPLDKAAIQKLLKCRKQDLIRVLTTAVANGVINEMKDGRKTVYTV